MIDSRWSHVCSNTSRDVLSSSPPPPLPPPTYCTSWEKERWGERGREKGRKGGRENRRNTERRKTNQRAISSSKWACWGVRNEEKEREKISTTKTPGEGEGLEAFSRSVFVWRSGHSLTLLLRRSPVIRVRGCNFSFFCPMRTEIRTNWNNTPQLTGGTERRF